MHEIHFAEKNWLYLLLIIPLISGLFFFTRKKIIKPLTPFIDAHLIPHLLINKTAAKSAGLLGLACFALAWSCMVIALAGPRWGYRDIETFSNDQSLVILLDLSESMNASDVKPSRLALAKQKIEDLLLHLKQTKMGLVAFAKDAHMMAPLTEDKEMIGRQLPSLSTDLVYVQGSRLTPALQLAGSMLKQEPGSNKAILVISDGGFEDPSAIALAKTYSEKGMTVHTMGIGTLTGAPIQTSNGTLIKKNDMPVISKLEKEKLMQVAKNGQGLYLEAHHAEQAEKTLEEALGAHAKTLTESSTKIRIWEEHFYLFLLPALPIFLYWFRQNRLLGLMLLFSLDLQAAAFKNQDQMAKEAFDAADYKQAAEWFQDPYRQGVALYREGNYEAAESAFKRSTRPEVASSAGYNLGNALAQQQKLEKAIEAYEDVLEKWPDHTKAKENLEIVKKMLEEQKQNSKNDQQQDQDQKDKKQNQDQQQDQDQKDKEQNQDQQQDQEQKDKEQNQDQQQSQEQNQPENQEQEPSNQQEQQQPSSQEESKQELDEWMNQISNDPKQFLKNKFYIESKKAGTTQGVDPW